MWMRNAISTTPGEAQSGVFRREQADRLRKTKIPAYEEYHELNPFRVLQAALSLGPV